jgi:hypothetical protein
MGFWPLFAPLWSVRRCAPVCVVHSAGKPAETSHLLKTISTPFFFPPPKTHARCISRKIRAEILNNEWLVGYGIHPLLTPRVLLSSVNTLESQNWPFSFYPRRKKKSPLHACFWGCTHFCSCLQSDWQLYITPTPQPILLRTGSPQWYPNLESKISRKPLSIAKKVRRFCACFLLAARVADACWWRGGGRRTVHTYHLFVWLCTLTQTWLWHCGQTDGPCFDNAYCAFYFSRSCSLSSLTRKPDSWVWQILFVRGVCLAIDMSWSVWLHWGIRTSNTSFALDGLITGWKARQSTANIQLGKN